MSKPFLLGMTLAEIQHYTNAHKWPKYLAGEIARWVYQKGANHIEELTTLSKKHRKLLQEHFEMGRVKPLKVNTSADGTRKYLFPARGGRFIETVYMPEEKRHTVCISSQVGCKLGCKFCMTARQGFDAHLKARDIINQIQSLDEADKITNLVFMGMGEPFDNTDELLKALEIITADYGLQMSPRKINVSTVGLIPGLKRFIEESNCHLAISLHSPFHEERKELMPIERAYPIEEVLAVLKSYPFDKQRRISFEYILFKGLNDSERHVKQLARLLNGVRCRMNLLRFHAIPDSPLQGCNDAELNHFRDQLNQKGIITTVRASRGEDILAACGLLSTQEISKTK